MRLRTNAGRNSSHVPALLCISNVEESIMRKIVSAALLSAFVSMFSLPVVAQTSGSTPAPTGPADCKANETWDAVTKTCKVN